MSLHDVMVDIVSTADELAGKLRLRPECSVCGAGSTSPEELDRIQRLVSEGHAEARAVDDLVDLLLLPKSLRDEGTHTDKVSRLLERISALRARNMG